MIEFTKEEKDQVLAALVAQYEAWDDLIDGANAGPRPDTEHVEFLTEQRSHAASAYLKLDPRGIPWLLAQRRAVPQG